MDNISERVVDELNILCKEATLPKEIMNHESFKKIWNLLNTDEFIKYSPISNFAFNHEEIDSFHQALEQSVLQVKKENEFYKEKARKNFLEILDHMALVRIQGHSIDERQQKMIDARNKELREIKRSLAKTTKELENNKDKLKNITNKLTIDSVTILGIFTSISFATFGGLQLLGNVFGRVKNTDSASIGSELMLGAVFLFGTYMILIALLTGISKIMDKEYRTSFPTRYLVISSFFIIFMFGLIYANVDYVDIFTRYIGWWMLGAIILTILLLGSGLYMDFWHQKRHKDDLN